MFQFPHGVLANIYLCTCTLFVLVCINNYRLLDVLLYNTGIYLDEYTVWKVILDEPLGESNMTFQAVYESKYIPYCTVKCITTFLFYI